MGVLGSWQTIDCTRLPIGPRHARPPRVWAAAQTELVEKVPWCAIRLRVLEREPWKQTLRQLTYGTLFLPGLATWSPTHPIDRSASYRNLTSVSTIGKR